MPFEMSRRSLVTGAATVGASALLPGQAESRTKGSVVLGLQSQSELDRSRFAASLLGKGARVVRRTTIARGRKIDYDLTLGAIELKDEHGKPWAHFVYYAYTLANADRTRRPVTFAWGGGPSGPSTRFHLQCLGPKLYDSKTKTFGAHPESILDQTDLVFVDPVGTGWSVSAGRYPLWEFYSVGKDGSSVAQFIRRYLSETGRPNAPIYLTGASYGTLRLPTVVHFLAKDKVPVAGVFPVSAAMDGNAFWEGSGNMAAFYLMIPNYAAIAWYHKRQLNPKPTLLEAYQEAADFALGDYISGLMKWPQVAPSERIAVLARLRSLTGISEDVWERYRLRIRGGDFSREFLKDQGQVLLSNDARKSRPVKDEPMSLAAFLSQRSPAEELASLELGIKNAPSYRGLAPGMYTDEGEIGPHPWDMTDHRAFYTVGGFSVPSYPNFLDDLVEGLALNPKMRIQQHSGYFDLQCSSFPANWSLSNINVSDDLRRNIELFTYPAGHGVFDDKPELIAFLSNVSGIFTS